MRRIVVIAVLALVAITTLTGCWVKKKDPETLSRTTDNLRVYQAGDYINYNVTATRVPVGSPPVTQTGTLRIEWFQHDNLAVPFATGVTIPVIQEVSTLNLGGVSNSGTVRYISQDANGKVTLHAIEAPGANEHYWLNTDGDATLSTIESFTIFNSPIIFGDQTFDTLPTLAFHVMENCEIGANCDSSIGTFADDHDVVGDSTTVTTNLGIFINPFQINFTGSANPSDPPFTFIFDIRDACGTNFTQHGNAGNGIMFVMPEIGMIQMNNTCIDAIAEDTVYYTITVSSTNISLPW